MIVRTLLRSVAVAIGAVAFVDPTVTRDVSLRQSLTIITMGDDDVARAARLQRLLSRDFEVAVDVADPTSLAAACPSTGGCIVVSRGDVPRRLSAGATVIGAVRVTTEPRVIRRVDVPRTVHRDAAAWLRVTLTRPVSRVEVLDGDVVVGSAEPGDSLEVDVTWVPLTEGARALRVIAGGDTADVGVMADAAPVPVFVYEPEPTWMGTFVRRALEDDVRFVVAGRTSVAPAVSVTRGDAGPLSPAAIGDARVVLVSSPHRLSMSDVELLERYVTRRGGSLILIPGQRPSGAVLRLIPPVLEQQRDRQPRDLGLLRVREWLTFARGTGITTLAAFSDDPVVVSHAIGRGRVVISGALDAWRFRDAASNFNTFWSSLAWEAAIAAGSPLHVSVEPVLARSGEPRRVQVELQSIDEMPTELTAAGSMTCDGQRKAVRLWPEGRPGTFEGVMRSSGSDTCQLTVTVNDITTMVPLAVRSDVQRVGGDGDALDAAVEAHGGIVVADTEDGERALIGRAGARLPLRHARQATWPMRAPYWAVLFAACLSCEWWLRRRAGLG